MTNFFGYPEDINQTEWQDWEDDFDYQEYDHDWYLSDYENNFIKHCSEIFFNFTQINDYDVHETL